MVKFAKEHVDTSRIKYDAELFVFPGNKEDMPTVPSAYLSTVITSASVGTKQG